MTDQCNLDSLPPELQAMILELLPTSARKAMRLVSKQCGIEAAKALWTDATIDIASTRPLKDLMAISPHGFVDNVKKLSIGRVADASIPPRANLRKKEQLESLNTLIRKLPRNCLTAYQCKDSSLGNISVVLLRRQTRLSKLVIAVTEYGLPAVQDSLDELRSLQIQVTADTRKTSPGNNVWTQQTPQLQDLMVQGTASRDWFLFPQAHWPSLLSLTLCDLDLKRLTKGIATTLDMPRLKALELDSCTRSAAFLQLIADNNEESGSQSLKSFICRGGGYERTYYDTRTLLQSAKGLNMVVFDIWSPERRPFMSKIGPPINAWKELQLTLSGNDPSCYNSDLEYIVPAARICRGSL